MCAIDDTYADHEKGDQPGELRKSSGTDLVTSAITADGSDGTATGAAPGTYEAGIPGPQE